MTTYRPATARIPKNRFSVYAGPNGRWVKALPHSGCESFYVYRETRKDDFYATVRASSGNYEFDGWIEGSSHATPRQVMAFLLEHLGKI